MGSIGNDRPGLHIFGIQHDGRAVVEVYVKPAVCGETLEVFITRDPDVQLLTIVEIFVGVSLELRKLARNPATVAQIEKATAELKKAGKSPI